MMVKEEIREEYLSDKALHDIDKLLPDEHTLRAIASFYSIFSDSTRIRIISALSINEMCVGDLATLLRANQSTISHQLQILRSYGIVDFTRMGKMVFYYVNSLLVDDVMNLGIENMLSKN